MAIIKALVNLVFLCVPAVIAGLVSARLSRTSREEWALLAWVPPLPLLAFGLYVGIEQARDPTAANLWPFVMVFLAAITGVLFGVFLGARKLFGSDDSVGRRRRDRTL